MRSVRLLLVFSGFLAVLYLPSTAVSQKPPRRNWRGWFLMNKVKCQDRCLRKDGYFIVDDSAHETSVGKIYLLKCQCMVSKIFKDYLTSKFNKKVANSYSRMNFYGRTAKARANLEKLATQMNKDPVVFLTQEEFEAYAEQEGAGGNGGDRSPRSGRQSPRSGRQSPRSGYQSPNSHQMASDDETEELAMKQQAYMERLAKEQKQQGR